MLTINNFDENKFYNNFYSIISKYENIVELFKNLNSNGELYIFGGAVRHYLDNGNFNTLPRDFDIIFKKKDSTVKLEKIITQYFKFKKNRFNGYKFQINNLKFDIWNIEDTWAFRENKVKYDSQNYISKLTETVFLNIDSLIFDLNNKKLYADNYKKIINTKELDIVLNENPFLELNLLRALILMDKYNLSPSRSLIDIFNSFVSKNNNYNNVFQNIFNKRYQKEKIEMYSRIDNMIKTIIRK
jgi:hypothetical protein cdifA_08857